MKIRKSVEKELSLDTHLVYWLIIAANIRGRNPTTKKLLECTFSLEKSEGHPEIYNRPTLVNHLHILENEGLIENTGGPKPRPYKYRAIIRPALLEFYADELAPTARMNGTKSRDFSNFLALTELFSYRRKEVERLLPELKKETKANFLELLAMFKMHHHVQAMKEYFTLEQAESAKKIARTEQELEKVMQRKNILRRGFVAICRKKDIPEEEIEKLKAGWLTKDWAANRRSHGLI